MRVLLLQLRGSETPQYASSLLMESRWWLAKGAMDGRRKGGIAFMGVINCRKIAVTKVMEGIFAGRPQHKCSGGAAQAQRECRKSAGEER